jgi:cytochrome c5
MGANSRSAWGRVGAAAALLALLTAGAADLRAAGRSGPEVVEAYCVACHRTGVNGAPRIGDVAAWRRRADQGLSTLTDHAINGIRQMPAHGNSPALTNDEIKRAVTTMVNRSGGRWVDPLDPEQAKLTRTGEQIVQTRCAKCHETGAGGAPRIGDRSAWAPRFARGLDFLVKSAIHGHGAMPARGGLVDASDEEIRAAILYMLNAERKGAASASPR